MNGFKILNNNFEKQIDWKRNKNKKGRIVIERKKEKKKKRN